MRARGPTHASRRNRLDRCRGRPSSRARLPSPSEQRAPVAAAQGINQGGDERCIGTLERGGRCVPSRRMSLFPRRSRVEDVNACGFIRVRRPVRVEVGVDRGRVTSSRRVPSGQSEEMGEGWGRGGGGGAARALAGAERMAKRRFKKRWQRMPSFRSHMETIEPTDSVRGNDRRPSNPSVKVGKRGAKGGERVEKQTTDTRKKSSDSH